MKLSFVLDQTSEAFRAGDELKGKLVIHATTTESISARHIALYFRGKEYTQVTFNGSSKADKTINEKHQFVYMEIPVSNIGSIIQYGRVVPGFHEVPFWIRLPADIPSTMYVSAHPGDSAAIAYCLRAKLIGSGILKDYQARQTVQIVARGEPLAEKTVPYTVSPTTRTINTFGWFGNGGITYGATMDTTKLVPGQQARVKIALVNNSQVRIDQVKVELQEMVRWSAEGHSRTFCRSPCVQRYPEHHFMKSQKIDSLPLPSVCSLPPIPQQYVQETFQGTAIQVTHHIHVKIKTKPFATNPEFNVPIQIVQGICLPEVAASRVRAEAQVEIPVAIAEPINDNYFTDDASSDPYPPSMDPAYISTVGQPSRPPPPPPINPTLFDKAQDSSL